MQKLPTITRPDWVRVAQLAHQAGGSLVIPGPTNPDIPYTMNGAHAALFRRGFAICQHPEIVGAALVYRRVNA